MDRPKTADTILTLTGLFLLTASSLSFEVALTRIYSFLFVQNYVYIIISCSMAGLGFGAVATWYLPEKLRPRVHVVLLFIPALMLIALLLLNSLHTLLLPSLLLTFLVFVSVGMVQVRIFKSSELKVSNLYAADLAGASLGSLLSFFFLNALGTIGAGYVIILLMSGAFIAVHIRFSGKKSYSLISGLVIAAVLGTGYFAGAGSAMYPNRTWEKEMTVMLDNTERNPRITETRWSAFGRVDLVENDNPYFKTMFIDGGAGTKMIRMENGQVTQDVARSLLLQYMGGIPLLVVEQKDRQRAAVIGSGGGIDVVTLLLADYREIDAVEINPDFIEIVQDYRKYTGDLYNSHPRVRVHLDEGRSFLRNSGSSYNLILMGLPIIKSARNLSNHALTENYLFTQEAFQDYLTALEPGGLLVVIAHYPNELRRLFTNAVRAMQLEYQIPADIATQHLVCIGDDYNPTLVVKKGVFDPSEVAGFNAILTNLPVTGSTNFVPFSGDGVEVGADDVADVKFNPAMIALSEGSIGLRDFIAGSEEDISWVSDDSPFFYQMTRGLPMELRIVGSLVTAILLLTLLLFLFRNDRPEERAAREKSIRLFLSFGFIGLGYMLVEIAVLQKFIVFWHHQTLALAIVLAAVLVSSSAGSLISSRIPGGRIFSLTIGVLVAIQILAALFLGTVLEKLETLNTGLKILTTVGLTFPIFVLMGVPFPTLMKKSREISDGTGLYPWMMGFNSLTTLAGGVLAMILAMLIGYRAVMAAGVLSYIALFLNNHSSKKVHFDLQE